MDSAHPGRLPWDGSLFDVGPENVQVLSIKRAESAEDSTVIRIQERSGVATTASVRSAALDLDQKVALRPWEMKTLRIKRPPGGTTEVRETSSLE